MVDLSQRLTQIRKERGMTVDQVCERLKGITCGLKNTSCSD